MRAPGGVVETLHGLQTALPALLRSFSARAASPTCAVIAS